MKKNDKPSILSPKILERFKALGDQGNKDNPIVLTRLIESSGSTTMYLTSYNPKNHTAYGFVILSFMDLVDAEFKYIDMTTLEEMKESGETTMYMDTAFNECDLKVCIDPNLYIENVKKMQKKRDKKPGVDHEELDCT